MNELLWRFYEDSKGWYLEAQSVLAFDEGDHMFRRLRHTRDETGVTIYTDESTDEINSGETWSCMGNAMAWMQCEEDEAIACAREEEAIEAAGSQGEGE